MEVNGTGRQVLLYRGTVDLQQAIREREVDVFVELRPERMVFLLKPTSMIAIVT